MCPFLSFLIEINGQSERSIQVLEDMLRECVIDFGGHWDKFLPLDEFSYNNSYHSNIQMTLFEAVYGRRCLPLMVWFDEFEIINWGTDLLRDSLDKVKSIQDRLLITKGKQKSDETRKVPDLDFMIGEKVLLKVLPMKGGMRFGNKGKLNSRFICPFEVHWRIREVDYELAMPPTYQINDDTNLVAQHRVLQQDVHGLDMFEMPTIDSSTALIVDISLTVANEKPPDTVPAERLLRFHLQPPDQFWILVDLFTGDKPVRDKGKRDKSNDNVEYEKEVAWAQKREQQEIETT
ncbi:hypothetical protein MTR67_002219 [Solanum verrucosum]|uniref:Tf2-1-like SH3-like domain-containing protein n=1 Tax=Solanum verrucosum TaxID=315347 RepID=A0AAF0PPN6_SOLVR|nr:hypothetical protein MTR67_002219 [Solanum verrucosum]